MGEGESEGVGEGMSEGVGVSEGKGERGCECESEVVSVGKSVG